MKNVIKVYDNLGASRDRYCVITDLKTYKLGNSTISKALFLSDHPHLSNGISLWTDCNHNSFSHHKEIEFDSLPNGIKHHIAFRIEQFHRTQAKMSRRVRLISDAA